MNSWNRFKDHFFWVEKEGFGLDTSRSPLPDAFEQKFPSLIQGAIEHISDIESGEIVNVDEQRAVGHYWLRAPELAPNKKLREEILSTIHHIQSFVKDVHSRKINSDGKIFSDVLCIGIGGSALGPELLSDVFRTEKDPMRLHFIDNTDPDGFLRVWEEIGERLAQTLVLVTSKSGATPEPRNALLATEQLFQQKGLNFSQRAVAITCEGSELDQRAIKESWLARFPMWDWVGGRTSITSAVGLLPAALQGIDIQAFLAGAQKMDEWTRRKEQNPALQLAFAWQFSTDGQGNKDMVVLPYRDALTLFPKYLQQLVMESLGKERNLEGQVVRQGISVYGNKGTTDQHSYIQQLVEGLDNCFVTFIEVLKNRQKIYVDADVTAGDYLEAFYLGTREALSKNNRPTITITLRELSPFSLGMLIALYERAVGIYAFLIQVNAYHQPGVEAGKKAAKNILQLESEIRDYLHQHSKIAKTITAEELTECLHRSLDTEMIFKLLMYIRQNDEI